MTYWPLIVALASTFYLVGLIWVVQLLVYPLFGAVGPNEFLAYHADHIQRIVGALSIPVLLQFGSAFLLLVIKPEAVPDWAVWLNLALTFGFWFITAALQIPIHNKLDGGFSAALVQELVTSNWVRTLYWTAQGFLLVWMLIISLK